MDNPYPICENCIFVDVPSGKDPCRECSRAFLAQRIKPNFVRKVRKRKPITNADRIRSMSDMELARKLYDVSWKVAISSNEIYTEEDWLDWLKEEVVDGV